MINIGIDLGRTVAQSEPKVTGSHFKKKSPFPDAFDVINKLTKKFNVYIVSRVNSEQKDAAHAWFEEIKFFENTRINKDNVFFCFERRDKSFFVKGLGISIFIDDRPDVLMYMESSVTKILFNPYPPDVEKYKNQIEDQNMLIAKDWKEVESIINNL